MDAIFLDLDGTLTDPKIGITRSIQYALGALDQPVPSGLQRRAAEQAFELWPRVDHVVSVDDHPLRHP